MPPLNRFSPRARFVAATASLGLLLAGCSADPTSETAHMAAAEEVGSRLPSSHVHGVGRDPGDGSLLLATHEGLFRSGPEGYTRIGPNIDLMGFAVVGPGHYYASGHPNAVRDLPQPMGLIESTDGGATWSQLSRGGQSDFHALARAGDTVVGFDGRLRRTADGRTWTTSTIGGEPRTLTADPEGGVVLATTAEGLLASADQGATWAPVPDAPRLLHVAWGDARTVVGVAPDGRVAMSDDGARTWRMTGADVPPPQAVSASTTSAGLEILVVTEREVLRSGDGVTFTPTTT